MDWLKARLVEQSTWQGLGYLLVAVGVMPVAAVPLLVSVGVGVVGAVKVITKE